MKAPDRVVRIIITVIALALITSPFEGDAAEDPKEMTIIDASHYSNVFGETRHFRVFLPPGYSENNAKRYPVIYFFHGWSQRYFGSSNPYGDFDKGDDNGGDNIANFVSDHDVIVVKPDGYNRSPDEPYYVRPYNVSPVETYRQFPLYFPELVKHIDMRFRTIADRGHRGISGLSMGGFMTFWIGGKYPHLLSAAGNFCGSPEFMVGPKDFPAELRHLDLYNNYGGMNVRLHYGDKDFIRGYHQDLNRIWTQVLDNYDYKVFNAAHSTCGMGEMLSFILKTFENPPARPDKWAHTDVYPAFSVWDYEINTDRTVPGFTVLEKVDNRGFRISVREFLPDGPLLPSVNVSVTTAPIYEKNQWYSVRAIDTENGKTSEQNVQSDSEGKLTIRLTGSSHEVGVNKKTDKPNVSLSAYTLGDARWASHGEEVRITPKLLNKGGSSAKNLRLTLSATRPTTTVTEGEINFGSLDVDETRSSNKTFAFRVKADSIQVTRLKLAIRDGNKNEWVEYFEVPLKKKVPEITDFEIADGRTFTVTESGIDTTTMMLGTGNGDGVANPGESIVILIKDQDKWWRANLTGTDPHINPFGIKSRKSDNWTSFDHVGASAKYDVPLIASDCPQNHLLKFFVEYWLPEYPLHIIKQGTVSFEVKGKDTTVPVVKRVQVGGDNLLQVRIEDGGKVKRVKATLVEEKKDGRSVESLLNDDGTNGDRVANDLVFSAEIPRQVFGIFRVTVEAEDAFGNTTVETRDEKFVLH